MPHLILILLVTIVYLKRREILGLFALMYRWHLYMMYRTHIGRLVFMLYTLIMFILYGVYVSFSIDDLCIFTVDTYNMAIAYSELVLLIFMLIYLLNSYNSNTISYLLHRVYLMHLYLLNHPNMGYLIYIIYISTFNSLIIILNLYWLGYIDNPIVWLFSLVFILILIWITLD